MMCPKDIYQAHLDKAGQAILDYDFSTVLDMIHYPSFIETDDVTLRIPDRESYLPSIKSLRDNFAKRGVTAYYRICREAVFAHDDPNRIEGIHEVYALSGATPVLDPYLTQMSLILRDGKGSAQACAQPPQTNTGNSSNTQSLSKPHRSLRPR